MGEAVSGVYWLAANHPDALGVWERYASRQAALDRALMAFLDRYDPSSSEWAHEEDVTDG